MLASAMSRLLVEEIAYGDPLPVFARFARLPGAIFLDSAVTSATVGRYSFIAAEPFLTLKSRDGQIDDGDRRVAADPFAVLAEHLARYRTEPEPALPAFQPGAAGYFAYDLARHLERLPAHRLDDQPMPDLLLGFYDWTIAFDHAERRALAMANGHPATSDAARRERGVTRLAWVRRHLAEAVAPPSAKIVALPRPDLDRATHEAGVRRVIEYILAGDIYQANLTQRFSATLP